MAENRFAFDHTPCPSEDQLAALAAGQLPDRQLDSIATHLEHCSACQARLAELDDCREASIDKRLPDQGELPFVHEAGCGQAVDRAERQAGAADRGGAGMGQPQFGHAGQAGGPHPRDARHPRSVGDYELLEPLGEGGMGTVFKARHRELGTIHAIKLLHVRRLADPVSIDRFEREMIAIGRLDHPNVVRAVDAGDAGGVHYLVMEFVEGVDLSRLVAGPPSRPALPMEPTIALASQTAIDGNAERAVKPPAAQPAPEATAGLRVADACEVIRQAALGLDYAHRQGRIHRDVKPSNLMLTPEGIVKLLDLGLARLGEQDATGPSESSADAPDGVQLAGSLDQDLTHTNQMMGTLEYMAPEQGTDPRSVDARADIYSLGCTLYKLLAGQAPFGEPKYRSAARQILAHAQATPPPIRQRRPDIPPALAEVLDRMLAKNPEQRFATARQVADAIAPFATGADLTRLLGTAGRGAEPDTARPVAPTIPQAKLPPRVVMPPGPEPIPTTLIVLGFAVVGLVVMCSGVGLVGYWSLSRSTRIVADITPPVVPKYDVQIERPVEVIEQPVNDPLGLAQPVGPTVDLLALIDLERDGAGESWQRDGQSITSLGRDVSRLQIPYLPPADYDVQATIELPTDGGGVNLGVVVSPPGSNPVQCLLIVDGWPQEGFLSGPHTLDGLGLEQHKSRAWRGRVVPVGRPVELVYQVRSRTDRSILRVTADGRELFTWRGAPHRLGLEASRKPPLPDTLFLEAAAGPVKISRLELVPLSTGGRGIPFAQADVHPALAAAQRAVWKGAMPELSDGYELWRLPGQGFQLARWTDRDGQRSLAAAEDADVPPALSLEAIDTRSSNWLTPRDIRLFLSTPGLRRARLEGGDVSGRELNDLPGLDSLEELVLAGADLRGWTPGSYPALRYLDLRGALLDDAVLDALPKWSQLTTLDLSRTATSDESLARLAELENLQNLHLDDTLTTDQGLTALTGLQQLKRLSLTGTAVTDAAIDPLTSLGTLEELRLLGTNLSVDGVAQLQQSLVGCRIESAGDASLDLLRLVREQHGAGSDEWQVVGQTVASLQRRPARLPVPIQPPAEYDLEAIVRRNAGTGAVVFQLPMADRLVMLGVDHWPERGGYTILHDVDGLREMASPVKVEGTVVPLDQDVRLKIQVRSDRIALLVDDRPVLDWQGDIQRLGPHEYYRTSSERALGVAVYNARVAVQRLTLTPVSGQSLRLVLAPTPRDNDRELAETLREKDCRLTVTLDGGTGRVVESQDDLPRWPFWIRSLKFAPTTQLTDKEFAAIAGLSRLEALDLAESAFDESHLASLGHLAKLRSLNLSRTPVTEAALEALEMLPELRSLYLTGTQVSDQGLASVGRLSQLNALSLSGTRISSTGIAHLSGLGNLQQLYLNNIPPLDAEAWTALAQMPSLRVLHLNRSHVDDQALALLAESPGLARLQLDHTRISDAGVVAVSRLDGLLELTLNETQVTDQALALLGSLAKLEKLSLSFCQQVSDASVPSLASLSRLKELGLYGTRVSRDGLARLQVALPDCSITAPGWRTSPGDLPLPPDAGPAVDLLALIDLQRDTTAGAWERDSGGLLTVPHGLAMLQIPYLPPDEYRIEATVENLSGGDGPNFGVLVGDRRCRLAIDNWRHLGSLSGPHFVNGRGLDAQQNLAFRGRVIPMQRPVHLVATVRKVGDAALLRVEADGREVFTWQGRADQLSVDARHSSPARVPYLMCWHARLRFSRLELTPLGRTGRVVEFADRGEQPELAAAQRVLWKGGRVMVTTHDGTERELTTFEELAAMYEPADPALRAGQPAESDPVTQLASTTSGTPRLAITAIDIQRSNWFHARDLAWFSRLSALERLTWTGTELSRDELAELVDVPQLQDLRLEWCRLTPGAGQELSRFAGLRRLVLSGSMLPDEDLDAIGALVQLQSLDLTYSNVTDAGLTKLLTLNGLNALKLDHTQVTDQAFATLAQLPELRTVSLSGTQISDPEQASLVKQVERLTLFDTRLTPEGLATLRGKLPGARILGSHDESIDLLPLVELKSPLTKGTWRWTEQQLVGERDTPVFGAIPMTPPEEYDIEMVARRLSGSDGIGLLLIGGGRQFLVEFDHDPLTGSYTLVDMVDGKRGRQNETAVQGVTFLPGVPVRVTVQVRRDRVRVLREDVLVVDWPADFQRLSVHGLWKTEHARILGVGAWQSELAIEQLTLRPLSGPLETARLRPTALTSQWELARWAQQAGGSAHVTLDGIQTQVLGPTDNLPEQPLWVRRIEALAGTELVAEDFDRIGAAHELAYLDLTDTSFDEAWLDRIGRLPGLTTLMLENTPLTDEGLRHLTALSQLNELNLNGTNVTDAGLRQLAELPLARLRLGRTQVSGTGFEAFDATRLMLVQLGTARVDSAGFAHLARLKSLRHLDIAGARIGDDDLALLDGMNELGYLHLGYTQVKGPGLAHLKQLPKLQRLDLTRTDIDDPALEHVAALQQLTMLNLNSTPISDQGLSQLVARDQLRELILTNSRVSEQAALKLLEKLPKLQIRIGDKLLPAP